MRIRIPFINPMALTTTPTSLLKSVLFFLLVLCALLSPSLSFGHAPSTTVSPTHSSSSTSSSSPSSSSKSSSSSSSSLSSTSSSPTSSSSPSTSSSSAQLASRRTPPALKIRRRRFRPASRSLTALSVSSLYSVTPPSSPSSSPPYAETQKKTTDTDIQVPFRYIKGKGVVESAAAAVSFLRAGSVTASASFTRPPLPSSSASSPSAPTSTLGDSGSSTSSNSGSNGSNGSSVCGSGIRIDNIPTYDLSPPVPLSSSTPSSTSSSSSSSSPTLSTPYDNSIPNELPPVIVGIAGGSGSGKTTLTQAIVAALGSDHVTYISHDSYYKDLSHLPLDDRIKNNFDHPESLDTELLKEHLVKLRRGLGVQVPVYDFTTHSRTDKVHEVTPRRIVIIDGILIFADSALCDLMDMKIYVDTEDDIRLIRRIQRDTMERQRSVASIIEQYTNTVRPMHQLFVEPSKKKADIIVPAGQGIQAVALEMCVSRLREIINFCQ